MYRKEHSTKEYTSVYGHPSSQFGYKRLLSPMFTAEKFKSGRVGGVVQKSWRSIGRSGWGTPRWLLHVGQSQRSEGAPFGMGAEAGRSWLRWSVRHPRPGYVLPGGTPPCRELVVLPHWKKEYDTSDLALPGCNGEPHDLGLPARPNEKRWQWKDGEEIATPNPAGPFLERWKAKAIEVIIKWAGPVVV